MLPTKFEEKIAYEPNSGCWLWTASLTEKGYGRFQVGGESRRAHRVSYELHNGAIPDNMEVCHSCDVRSCVNPAHLFLGSRRDNMLDCASKGRIHPKNGRLLKPADVLKIRRDERSQATIGEAFGISQSAVSAIQRGASYSWVLDVPECARHVPE